MRVGGAGAQQLVDRDGCSSAEDRGPHLGSGPGLGAAGGGAVGAARRREWQNVRDGGAGRPSVAEVGHRVAGRVPLLAAGVSRGLRAGRQLRRDRAAARAQLDDAHAALSPHSQEPQLVRTRSRRKSSGHQPRHQHLTERTSREVSGVHH